MRSCQFDLKHHSVMLMLKTIIVASLLLGHLAVATASQVTGLYSAEVPVAGQSAEQRTDGIMRAFSQMLVKVTGNRNVTQRPELQEDIQKAPRYVQQYRYRLANDQTVSTAGQNTDEASAAEAARLLTVQFDAGAVQRLLRDRRLPVWGENRPSGLVWLGLESQGQRRMTRSEGDRSLARAMERTAEARGIPLMLPLMDLEDQASMQVADLWGDFEQNIRRASQRYTPDLIVTGRMTQLSSKLWRVTWHLYHGDRLSSWNDEGARPTALAQEGIEHVTDLLAERYAPVAGEDSLSRVRLRVSGVSRLRQYAGVGRFLQSQSSVERVEMISAEPDAITYDLRVRGGIQVLEQGLALGGVIEPITDLPDVDSQLIEGIDLFYGIR